MNIEFPEIYDHPVPTNRLVWRIFISVAGIGRLNVLVTPREHDIDQPLMSLIDEDFRWDMPVREMVDQIEMKIFSKIGQSLELPVDSYPSPSVVDRNEISVFLKRRRI